MARYLLCAAEPWAQAIRWPIAKGDTWTIVADPEGLREAFWNGSAMMPGPFSPATAFVLHWHWIIPSWLLIDGVTFIGFHASDLPAFRGGAPIENQQARGVWRTKLTAFQLDAGIDTGPILMQRDLTLGHEIEPGRWHPKTRSLILFEIGDLVAKMIPELVAGNYTPRPQGPGGSFYRRSDVPKDFRAHP